MHEGSVMNSNGLYVDHVNISNTPDTSMLLLLPMQTSSNKIPKNFPFLALRYVINVLRTLGNFVLVNRPPVHITLILLRPPVVRVMIGEGSSVDGRLSPRPRRSEITQRGTHSADHRRALRARRRRLLVPLPFRFAFRKTKRATQ